MSDDMSALRPELEAGLAALSLDLALASPLLAYVALLARWNATYNLTAVRDPREMIAKHLLDSLAMQPFVRGLGTLADLGTGPGLPGIPLAIATPSLQVTLVESNGKKARFLREAIRQLKLENASVAESRIEAFKPGATFDAITWSKSCGRALRHNRPPGVSCAGSPKDTHAAWPASSPSPTRRAGSARPPPP
jgi:16S rRNA (guanine527-N7)-methyltransferase